MDSAITALGKRRKAVPATKIDNLKEESKKWSSSSADQAQLIDLLLSPDRLKKN